MGSREVRPGFVVAWPGVNWVPMGSKIRDMTATL